MVGWLELLPGWSDLADVLLVAGMAWVVIRTIRRTRARAVLGGLGTLAVVYVLARSAGLQLSTLLLQGFFTVAVLVFVVLFQEDLRRVFEQLGSWRPGGRGAPPAPSDELDLIARTVSRLASQRTGALIVLPGRESIERHVEGGVRLNGRVSEPLLLSLFDASSPGHDGAVIVRDGQVERFAVHLPLSTQHEALGPGGTRHAAALGLSERCDATCIVVSEERGTISLARDGELIVLRSAEALLGALRAPERTEGAETTRWSPVAVLDASIALLAAAILWIAFVPGSETRSVEVDVPVEITNLPKDLTLEAVDPERVRVTIEGLRRDLVLLDHDDVHVAVDAYLARLGRRTFQVTAAHVTTPPRVHVHGVDPTKVRLSLVAASPESASPESPAESASSDSPPESVSSDSPPESAAEPSSDEAASWDSAEPAAPPAP